MNKNFRLHALYTLSIFSVLMRSAKGEHLLPIFTNLWYGTNDYSYDGVDACHVGIYVYDQFFASPMAVLEDFYNGCIWDHSTFKNTYNYTTKPSGFISTSTDDWNKITLDSNAAYMGTYQMLCTSASSGLKNTYSIIAIPYYECPTNVSTRLSYDNFTQEVGCTTTPMSCVADIVARDLNYTSIEFFGHVGLITDYMKPNPNVIQVLNNDDPGIHFSSLYGSGSFSDIGKYWGERYGLQQQFITRLPSDIATKIINEALDQEHYAFSYTILGYDYYPGGTTEHPYDCMFRCDSFVYFCYDAAGLKLQDSFSIYTVPFVIFDDFLCDANPIESCIIPAKSKNISLTIFDKKKYSDSYLASKKQVTKRNSSTATIEIFNALRPALITKDKQRELLPQLVNDYRQSKDEKTRELFARCLCFELKRMDPAEINSKIKPLLSDFLWQYQYLSEDNFFLAMWEATLKFYLKNPSCQWLHAYFSVNAETQNEKEQLMISYIDQQDSVIAQANLISGSQLSSLKTFSQERKCAYGKFFQLVYNQNKSLSNKERSLLELGLAEVKYPPDETTHPPLACRENLTVNWLNF